MTPQELKAGGYYRINKTKKILYWDGDKWMKPVKDPIKKTYTGHLWHCKCMGDFILSIG